MNDTARKIAGALILLALLGVAAFFVFAGGEEDADSGVPLLYGNVDIRELVLAFRQPGRVTAVTVEEGDVLATGAEVARLDDEPFREAVAVAEARVDVARARLEGLESGSRPQEIEQARAAVREAEARLEAARQEIERKLGLVGSGASSEREVEAARERHDASRARLESAREALALVLEGARPEDLDAGRAELRLAEAQLEQVLTALADTRLTSPSGGTVLVRAREPGAVVAAGAPVLTLSLREPVVVRAYVPETLLGAASPGTSVEVTTDSSPRVYRGRVGFVSPRAEFTPKTVETPELRTDLVYRLRVVVEDADERLLQGMPVTVRLLGDGPEPAQPAAGGEG